MDTALELRIKHDKGINISETEIDSLLYQSKLVQKLTLEINDNLFFLIWRIIALSEIPYSSRLPYTKNLIELILNNLGTSEGFSYTGKKENLLPCYNAILIKAFCKLGLHSNPIVKNGIMWILKYQSFERFHKSIWNEKEILKHGGCLKSTPCYIGLTKSILALHEYNKFKFDDSIQFTIDKGIDYILQHHLYKRLTNQNPISPHILDLYFPENYNITILELLWFLTNTKYGKDSRVQDSIDYINKKKNENGMWGVDYSYKSNGYISFDGKSKNGPWISYILNTIQERHGV
ncbi:MAG: hypothetical protein SH817_11970 [Leptospira sp.]|nr:hypothetical protein [Leptospira sp.]